MLNFFNAKENAETAPRPSAKSVQTFLGCPRDGLEDENFSARRPDE